MNSILQIGRSSNIDICVSKHLINDYKNTKVILTEANQIVIFPRGLTKMSIEYVFGNYIGMSKQDVTKMLTYKSRYISIKLNHPRILCTEHDIAFL